MVVVVGWREEEEGEEEEEAEVTAVAEAAKEVVVEPEPLAPLRPLEHFTRSKEGRSSSSAPVSTASEGGAAEVLVEAALAPANKMRAASTASCADAGSGGGGDADLLRLHFAAHAVCNERRPRCGARARRVAVRLMVFGKRRSC